jgi:two-component system chemotaxis response regulator CheY
MNCEATTILVVDDNAALNRVICFSLGRAGFAVTSAASGREALELAQQQTFAVVVSDQQMPELTGVQLVEQLQQWPGYHDCRFVLLAAKGFDIEPARLCRQLESVSLVAKPFSASSLVSHVQSLAHAVVS